MILTICDQNDKDSCSVGVPYEEEEPLQPVIEKWSALLPTPKDKEKFLKIIEEDYVFSEESLEPLAEIIGFDAADMNIPYDLAIEEEGIIRIRI